MNQQGECKLMKIERNDCIKIYSDGHHCLLHLYDIKIKSSRLIDIIFDARQ